MDSRIEIISTNGELVVSSRQVAGNFGKLHKDVLESIRGILAAENSATKFFRKSMFENRGKQYPEYIMNRDGFSLLVMGFTGKEAMEWKIKYINAFNEMEKKLSKPQLTPAEQMAQGLLAAQQLLAEKNKQVEHLEATIEEQKPKVLFADAVSASKTSILIGELAKLLKQNGIDIGQNRLFNWMRENGYIFRNGKEPTQRAMEMKLFEIKECTINNPDGSPRVTRTTKVTGKGQTYFINKFLKERK